MQNNSKQQKPLYESIFGVQAYSLRGPLFYFVLGVISLLIFVILLVVKAYVPGVANNTELLRPDITFPFIGFLVILSMSGAVAGIVLGLIGFFWGAIMKN